MSRIISRRQWSRGTSHAHNLILFVIASISTLTVANDIITTHQYHHHASIQQQQCSSMHYHRVVRQ